MAKTKGTPQKAALREMICDYLKSNAVSIKSGTDENSVVRDRMCVLLEGALDEELDGSWAIPNTIIVTKKPITVEMVIQRKPRTPIMVIWMSPSRGTATASMSRL